MKSNNQQTIKGFFSVSEAPEKKLSIPIYNIYNNINNNNTILAIQATTETSSALTCESLKKIYLQCDDCGINYNMEIGCNKKTCPACQSKRKNRLFKKYENLIANWENGKNDNYIQFLLLTHKNVFDLDNYVKSIKDVKISGGYKQEIKISSKYIEKCDKQLSAFKKRLTRQGYLADYGFINKEMTWTKEKGYHYHNHILFYGKKLNEDELKQMWTEVTKDSYIIGLKNIDNFNDNKHGLRYLLKYVAKVEDQNDGINNYYQCTKGARNFNTFGKRYGKAMLPQKQKIVCQECGGNLSLLLSSQPKNSLEIDFKKVRKQQRMNLLNKKIQSKDENQDFNYYQNKEEKLIEKIRNVISIEHNIDLIENLLDDKDIEYLLQIGAIYQSRTDEYRRI